MHICGRLCLEGTTSKNVFCPKRGGKLLGGKKKNHRIYRPIYSTNLCKVLLFFLILSVQTHISQCILKQSPCLCSSRVPRGWGADDRQVLCSLPPLVRTDSFCAPSRSLRVQTWRNSLPLYHRHNLPHPHPLHLFNPHHPLHPPAARKRDDPGGWRSCPRVCRRSPGTLWRCLWTRWSASSVCPLWSDWHTVRRALCFSQVLQTPERQLLADCQKSFYNN